jgi:DNA mismatch repair ATPase MutS
MNPVLAIVLNIAFPWDILFAYLGGRYQRHCSKYFPQWVHAWSELEALVSLANFAYLHPEYVFPEIHPEEEGANQPIFQAREMGHPLIPSDRKVNNDFSLRKLGEITLITGSNMSGKSTFLKTAGINLCLAYAGGPVHAGTFRTGLFRIFTCMQIQDSISDGLSFFYAEVKRLKTLLAVLHDEVQAPVFFLIDEIFKGTNSRERLIGSRAYIHHLSKQSGIGMIATHDLELGQLIDQISSLSNYHFRDNVTDGKMVFDYKLYPGLCSTTNALKIMRMEGLPVKM